MRTDERLLEIVSRVREAQCGCIASGGAKTCRELYGVGSWCSECLAHELADMVDLPAPAPHQTRDDFDAAARRERLRMRGSRFARWHADIRTDEDR